MFSVLFWIIVGVVVGWHLPQPEWARVALGWLKEQAVAIWDRIRTNKNDDNT